MWLIKLVMGDPDGAVVRAVGLELLVGMVYEIVFVIASTCFQNTVSLKSTCF